MPNSAGFYTPQITETPVNRFGEVAFQVTLDDGTDAVALWSPEPLPFPGSTPSRVTVLESGDVEFELPGLPGIRYQLETRESLTTGSREKTGDILLPTEEGHLFNVIPAETDQLFIRSGFAE